MDKKYKHIAVDRETYRELCEQGRFRESFGDIIKRLLLEAKQNEN